MSGWRAAAALVWMCGAVACSSEGDEKKENNASNNNSEAFPMFGLTRGQLCQAHCAKYEECLPDEWAQATQTQAECVSGCQQVLNEAYNNTRRPDCGKAIDSLYACQSQSCDDFREGWSPSVETQMCKQVEQRYRELCIL
jgi:hypothetical protein